MGSASRVDDFSTPCEGGGATPRGPEHHREHDPQSAGSHQDPADDLHVDRPVRCDVNGEGEYGANRQQKYSNSKTHAARLLVLPHDICRSACGGLSHEPGLKLAPFTALDPS